MKCDIILRKLLVQLFAVLSVTLCISGLNENKSYAITYDEFYEIMDNNVGNSNQNIINWWNGIKGQETTILGMEANWVDNNSIAIYSDYNNTYGWRGTIYFIHNSGSVYRNNYGIKWTEGRNGFDNATFTKSWFTVGAGNHNIDSFVPSYSDILSYGNIFNDNNSSWVFITDSDIYNNNTLTDLTDDTWYFKTYSLAPKFTKSVHNVVFYENTTTVIGTISGTYDKSLMQFLLYDITDPDNLYPPLIATLGNGINVLGSVVDLETRLIQVGHQYDLYYLYQGSSTEQFRYVWRNFMNESGEVLGGYNIQTGVNQLIDYQKSGDQQIIQALESGNKAIIDTIKSGDNAIISAITNTEISGDILGKLNMFDEIRF